MATATSSEITVMIVGKTGNGKSSLGNTLLGKDVFQVGSDMSTTTEKAEWQEIEIGNRKLKVVDTPDITETNFKTDIPAEVNQWKTLTRPGPDAILLTIRCDVRFTPEELQKYQRLKKELSDLNVHDRLVVAFTFGDRQKKDIKEELKTIYPELQTVLKDASNRYLLFDNLGTKEDKENMVDALFKMLDELKVREASNKCTEDLEDTATASSCESEPLSMAGKADISKGDEQPDEVDAATSSVLVPEYTVMIVGKTGNGKSSLGNTLLGADFFQVGPGLSTTTEQSELKENMIGQRKLKVVDTPDITETNFKTDILAEVNQWKTLTHPGPDAILLTIRCDVRFTPEELQKYQRLKKELSDLNVHDRLVVAFTFGDRQKKDIKEELKTIYPELQTVLKDASNRYLLFDNLGTKEDKKSMVDELLKLLDKLKIIPPTKKANPSFFRKRSVNVNFNCIKEAVSSANRRHGHRQWVYNSECELTMVQMYFDVNLSYDDTTAVDFLSIIAMVSYNILVLNCLINKVRKSRTLV